MQSQVELRHHRFTSSAEADASSAGRHEPAWGRSLAVACTALAVSHVSVSSDVSSDRAPRPLQGQACSTPGREDAAVLRRGEMIEHFGFNLLDLRGVARREASEDV